MGVFEIKLLRDILGGDFSMYKVAVETGTCLGYSTKVLAEHYREVFTIELDSKLYELAKANFFSDNNIHCLQGDSKEVLPKLAEVIDEPCVFFLDAHFSGNANTDWKNSEWKGYPGIETAYAGEAPTPENQVPLDCEIKTIVEKFRHQCIIYIDDMDKFDTNGQGTKNLKFAGEDWSHLSVDKIKLLVKNRLLSWHKVGDCQLAIVLSALHN
jgi:hypothetical protein